MLWPASCSEALNVSGERPSSPLVGDGVKVLKPLNDAVGKFLRGVEEHSVDAVFDQLGQSWKVFRCHGESASEHIDYLSNDLVT